MTKEKRTNIDLQNNTHKTKYRVTRTPTISDHVLIIMKHYINTLLAEYCVCFWSYQLSVLCIKTNIMYLGDQEC